MPGKILTKKNEKREWTVELDAFGFFLRSSKLNRKMSRYLFNKISRSMSYDMEAVTLFHGNIQYDEIRLSK